MGVTVSRGQVPAWTRGDGSGDGYGDGYGYGYGDGYGYGYGYGDGYGSIEDLVFCMPSTVNVTTKMLREHKACTDHLQLFERTFPNGAQWPRDRDQAIAAGLDLNWARQRLGLLPLLTE